MAKLQLALCSVPGDLVDPLLAGEVEPEGIELTVTRTDGSTAYWRQLKFAEFDVAVMSLTSFILAKSEGSIDAVGLPVFASRRWMHTDVHVNVDAGVNGPEDLKGKRIGVGEYQQTASIWLRGVLEHDFGVSQYDVEWWMERSEELSHGGSTGFTPPKGIKFQRVPSDKSLATMLVNGELDAAPIGRALRGEHNLIDRSTQITPTDFSKTKRLFSDGRAEVLRFFEKYQCVPATQMYVIRGDVYREHPWVAFNMYEAFTRAKRMSQETLEDRLPTALVLGREFLREARQLFGEDPYPYGVSRNRHMIETMIGFCQEQGLLEKSVAVEQLFAEQTHDA